MLCDKCKQREANVHVSQNINGVRYEQNLCAECAGLKDGTLGGMMGGGMGMEDIMRQMFGHGMEMARVGGTQPQTGGADSFESLGLTLPSFDTVEEAETEVQGNPKQALEAELKRALEAEEYERAAKLRDQIRALKDE